MKVELLVQEGKKYHQRMCKISNAIFSYANEVMFGIKNAGPQSYTQGQLFLCVYVKFCARAMCLFGARE